MRISERKTTIAVLRSILEIKVEEFSELARCSPDLVRKMENGDRPCSDSSATTLEISTGCSRQWILAGDRKSPCLAYNGARYSKPFFAEYRASKLCGGNFSIGVAVNVCGVLPQLNSMAEAAAENGRLAVFLVKLKDSLETLRKEFGFSREVFDSTLATMAASPEQYAWDTCDKPLVAGAGERIATSIETLKQKRVVFNTTIKAAVEDAGDYFARNPEMKPAPAANKRKVKLP